MQKYLLLIIRLWKMLKPFHKDFYLQLGSTVVQQAITVYSIYLTAKILDVLIHKNFEEAVHLTIMNLGILFVKIIVSYFTEIHAQNNIGYAIQQHLEEYSFKKIFKLNISQYTEDHSAIKEQVIHRGEMAIENIISTIVLNILPTVTQVFFAIIALSFYSKVIALWTFASLLAVILWSNYFAKYHRPFIKEDIDNGDKQKKIRTESFQHLSLIRTLGAEDFYLEKYLRNRQSIMDYKKFVWNKAVVHGHKRFGFFVTTRNFSTIIIIYLAYLGTVTVGSIYAIWSYINEANSQIFTIIQAIRQIPLRFSELEKYLDIVDKESLFDEKGIHSKLSGDIIVTNLNFKYPHGNIELFNNLSLTIPYGKKVAFVGSSGSGKSTIVKLLLRIYTYNEGSITINSNELKNIDSVYLRENIGYVEQHVDLFDDTIKENILVGVQNKNKKGAERRLEEIAKHARITEFYHRLGETKFDTYIGERGVKLSGGERQRIGIARAIIKNPEILIFDEATASLDAENEAKVMEAINDVSFGKTSIIIAHRLSTVRDADKIIVMDKGKVVGEGTHDELMQHNTLYQNLVAHQLSS
ncbi:MAG: ABC transporter ATP-binding protein [Candidatus Pacebacteria bacterium]|nr:ABC transporter ATP-binding protein [Candidatus Paceibacterota bacterium]MBP9866465.1 ABC transporter ATP-binding protein [Candidatus Paceibacterota bacterium]